MFSLSGKSKSQIPCFPCFPCAVATLGSLQEQQIQQLNTKVLALQARSMKNNMVIGGITEMFDEDCVKQVQDFLAHLALPK